MTTLSIIICTYNGAQHIPRCLNSILRQSFTDFEVLCVDGMSSDTTQALINSYSQKDPRVKLILNPHRLPEGEGNGKWLGYQHATGSIIGFIDQDNELQHHDLFHTIIRIFSSPLSRNLIGVLGAQRHDLTDSAVVRYVSLFGTDSFFAYRSLDFVRTIRNPQLIPLDASTLEQFTLTPENMLLTGGNCFFYSRQALDSIGGYTQDVLVIHDLLAHHKTSILVVPHATKHYAEKNLPSLAKKKFFWATRYHAASPQKQFRYFPSSKKELLPFTTNFLCSILIIPHFGTAFRMYLRSRDVVSFAFPFFAFLNTLAYGLAFLLARVRKRTEPRT